MAHYPHVETSAASFTAALPVDCGVMRYICHHRRQQIIRNSEKAKAKSRWICNIIRRRVWRHSHVTLCHMTYAADSCDGIWHFFTLVISFGMPLFSCDMDNARDRTDGSGTVTQESKQAVVQQSPA